MIWPSLILSIAQSVGIGIVLAKGERIGTTIISQLLPLILLYWGGFFNPLLGR